MDFPSIFGIYNNHLLNDYKPSLFFSEELTKEYFNNNEPFKKLAILKQIEQHKEHHPEGNVWNHTMLVLDLAAQHKEKSEDKKVFMWAALLHDIGKATTTIYRKGKITAYDHDKEGEKLAIEFLRDFGESDDFICKVSKLVRWHMQTLFVINKLPFADIESMKIDVNIHEVALLSLCDRLGRGKISVEKVKVEEENIKKFIGECLS